MTSKTSHSRLKTNTPYFYIIRHTETKIMYAGSRWAKKCHPSELLQPHGYQTSSKTINDIIAEHGLSIFEIIRIDTNLDGFSAYDYETGFLQACDCMNSKDWYNGNNNDIPTTYGTDAFKKLMLEKYGVENANDIPGSMEKIKAANMEKYGVENVSQVAEFKEKARKTNIERYGCENPMQNSTVKEKLVTTCLEKYGVAYTTQVPEMREKSKQTNLERYGVENPFQLEEFQKKAKQTIIERYGVENPFQLEEFQEKAKQTNIERYGVEHAFQAEQFKEKIKQTNIERYGVDHPSKYPFFTILENKKTYAKCSISRFYPELKQYF